MDTPTMKGSACVAPVALCLFLLACAPVSPQPTGSRLVSATSALAIPAPGGPPVVSVVERRYSNAVEQTIALETRADTGGQNSLAVRVLGLARVTGNDALVPTAMTDATIADEMRSALPGVRMSVSPAFLQNAYGPFGYAVGRGAGRDLCLYGWQRISGEVRTPFVRQGAIDTRLRFCEAGADERTLLAGMYGYTVQASFGPRWSTGAAPPALSPAIGEAGAPIYPASLQMQAAPLPAERLADRTPDRTPPARPARTGATAAASQSAPGAPHPAGMVTTEATIPVIPSPSFAREGVAAAAPASAGTPRVPSPPARVALPGTPR